MVRSDTRHNLSFNFISANGRARSGRSLSWFMYWGFYGFGNNDFNMGSVSPVLFKMPFAAFVKILCLLLIQKAFADVIFTVNNIFSFPRSYPPINFIGSGVRGNAGLLGQFNFHFIKISEFTYWLL